MLNRFLHSTFYINPLEENCFSALNCLFFLNFLSIFQLTCFHVPALVSLCIFLPLCIIIYSANEPVLFPTLCIKVSQQRTLHGCLSVERVQKYRSIDRSNPNTKALWADKSHLFSPLSSPPHTLNSFSLLLSFSVALLPQRISPLLHYQSLCSHTFTACQKLVFLRDYFYLVFFL